MSVQCTETYVPICQFLSRCVRIIMIPDETRTRMFKLVLLNRRRNAEPNDWFSRAIRPFKFWHTPRQKTVNPGGLQSTGRPVRVADSAPNDAKVDHHESYSLAETWSQPFYIPTSPERTEWYFIMVVEHSIDWFISGSLIIAHFDSYRVLCAFILSIAVLSSQRECSLAAIAFWYICIFCSFSTALNTLVRSRFLGSSSDPST